MQAKKLFSLILPAVMLVSATAYAQQAAPTEPGKPAGESAQGQAESGKTPVDQAKAMIDAKFKELDKNGDGFISKQEAAKLNGLAKNFAAADKNKDGKLDLTEFTALLSGT